MAPGAANGTDALEFKLDTNYAGSGVVNESPDAANNKTENRVDDRSMIMNKIPITIEGTPPGWEHQRAS
jgi:hypothetical protein